MCSLGEVRGDVGKKRDKKEQDSGEGTWDLQNELIKNQKEITHISICQ